MTARGDTSPLAAAQRTTIAQSIDIRQNSLNAIRLGLALLVIVSHAWPLTGRDTEPGFGGASLGGWAVLGFFSISGFLITRSRERARSTWSYYQARALRILPGFLVCITVVAFIAAPLSTLLEGTTYSPLSALKYLLHNAALYPTAIAQPGIDGTLTTVPYASNWNGSLWTLFWEGTCYIGIGVAFSIMRRRAIAAAGAAIVVLTSSGVILSAVRPDDTPSLIDRVAPLLLAFACGALLHLYRNRIIVSRATIGCTAALLVGCALLPDGGQLGAIPLSYLLLTIGGRHARWSITGAHDVSYGTYIYGWPVMQLLALTPLVDGPVTLYIAACVAATLVLAAISLVAVERPALSLKGRQQRRAAASTVTAAP